MHEHSELLSAASNQRSKLSAEQRLHLYINCLQHLRLALHTSTAAAALPNARQPPAAATSRLCPLSAALNGAGERLHLKWNLHLLELCPQLLLLHHC